MAHSIRWPWQRTRPAALANPIRWLWNQAQRLYRKLRGTRLLNRIRPSAAQRDRFIVQYRRAGGTDKLIDQLFEGAMDHQQWTLAMRQEIKSMHIAQYLAARGGREAMTQADWGRLGGVLRHQFAFLQRFEQDLIDGKLSAGQAKVRAGMYINNSGQSYERAKAVSRGLPDMPAYPKDGQTICLANCGCEWVYEETGEEWLCTWTLGATEHCPDCLDNAATWNPYVVAKPL